MFGVRPNMTGGVQTLRSAQNSPTVQGVFGIGVSRAALPATEGGKDQVFDLEFLASRSASIYAGTVLQPSALQTLACIRV